MFFGLIPIPTRGFKAVFGHSEWFLRPGILSSPRPTKAPGGAIANRPGRACRSSCRPQRSPGRLSADRGIFRWFFVPFSANFQADFCENFSGFCRKVARKSLAKVARKSQSRSAQSRRVAIKSRWRLTQRKSRRRQPGISWRCPRRYSRWPRWCSP